MFVLRFHNPVVHTDTPQAERRGLLYNEDGYTSSGSHNYGSWGQPSAPPQNVMSPEEVKREQQALDNITRWASEYVPQATILFSAMLMRYSQIVEIFPHQPRMPASQQLNGTTENGESSAQHQDILLSMIPGDKSKRSIRIYPASRPTSSAAQSVRSKASNARLNEDIKKKTSGIFVRLNVDLPKGSQGI